jgi:hypothetical protein
VGLGVLLAFELGVVEPELVGVIGFETGVGGLSAFKFNKYQCLSENNELYLLISI